MAWLGWAISCAREGAARRNKQATPHMVADGWQEGRQWAVGLSATRERGRRVILRSPRTTVSGDSTSRCPAVRHAVETCHPWKECGVVRQCVR